MVQFYLGNVREKARRYSSILIALSFALSGVMPIVLASQAGAAQLTSRRATISTSEATATASYTFDFTLPSGVAVQGIRFEFCTTALGACTKPTDMDVNTNASLSTTQTFSVATLFTEYSGADAGACDDHNSGAASTEYCVERTAGTAESAAGKTITVDGITNPSIAGGTNNTSLYVRISLYSDTAFATMVHEGAVAASIVRQLTVSGRVQERLVFCVFALEDDDTLPTDCADTEALESTSVDLGVVDNTTIARSPVSNVLPAIGNERFGAALINTNASNGVTLSYYASAGTGTNETRAFRVAGATCDASGTSVTDQCFVSANDATGETFTAGTERFGVQVACVVNSAVGTAIGTTANLGKNSGGTYTYTDGTGGSINTVYDSENTGTAVEDSAGDCENSNTSNKFGWRDSGTAQALISSTSVVDDEMVKIRYGATANPTTPTGTYTVASTYIATPTF